LSIAPDDRVVVTVDGQAELTASIDPSLAPGTIYVPFNQRASAALGAVGAVTIKPAGGSR
jgi:hypothetical protein